MDALMASSTPPSPSVFMTWDFVTKDGEVPYIEGQTEEDQRAQLAVFVQQGLVKQLPTIGVNWTAFLTKALSFDGLDAQIRNSLTSSGDTTHAVDYSAAQDKMIVTLERVN